MAKKPMTRKDIIREWISDNLRYMLLGLAILVVVGLIVLLVYLLSVKTGGQKDEQPAASTSVSASSLEAVSESGVSSSSESIVDESEILTASSAEEQKQEEEIPAFSENNVAGVTAICISYYEALGRKDLDIFRTLVDELTDEDAQAIENNTRVAGYRDISVYTLKGPEEGSYLAFIRYTTDYTGINTGLPMLGELYVYTSEDGSLKVMGYPENDAAITRAMEDAQKDAQAAELIGQVKANYELALETDPALSQLVDELS